MYMCVFTGMRNNRIGRKSSDEEGYNTKHTLAETETGKQVIPRRGNT